MARVSKNIAFTAPPAIVDEFEQIAKEEQSTKSELFRRMFRFYQASRKAPSKQPSNYDGNFDVWVEQVIFQAVEEKQTQPMSETELFALDDKLLAYGAERAQAVGITSEEQLHDIIHEERQKHR